MQNYRASEALRMVLLYANATFIISIIIVIIIVIIRKLENVIVGCLSAAADRGGRPVHPAGNSEPRR